MDWNMARVIRTEDNKYSIAEAMETRRWGPRTLNWDEGAYMFSHTWSNILEWRTNSWRCDDLSTLTVGHASVTRADKRVAHTVV